MRLVGAEGLKLVNSVIQQHTQNEHTLHNETTFFFPVKEAHSSPDRATIAPTSVGHTAADSGCSTHVNDKTSALTYSK